MFLQKLFDIQIPFIYETDDRLMRQYQNTKHVTKFMRRFGKKPIPPPKTPHRNKITIGSRAINSPFSRLLPPRLIFTFRFVLHCR